MKVILYRGPHTGKRFEVSDAQTTIRVLRRKPRHMRPADFTAPALGTFTVDCFEDEYRIVEYSHGGVRYPSRHPDGSVYFEWTQKRGTRIKTD